MAVRAVPVVRRRYRRMVAQAAMVAQVAVPAPWATAAPGVPEVQVLRAHLAPGRRLPALQELTARRADLVARAELVGMAAPSPATGAPAGLVAQEAMPDRAVRRRPGQPVRAAAKEATAQSGAPEVQAAAVVPRKALVIQGLTATVVRAEAVGTAASAELRAPTPVVTG